MALWAPLRSPAWRDDDKAARGVLADAAVVAESLACNCGASRRREAKSVCAAERFPACRSSERDWKSLRAWARDGALGVRGLVVEEVVGSIDMDESR